RFDASRSAIYLPRTKSFPKNTEIESTLTFITDDPGQYVRQVAPSPRMLTVREHHSFVELPDNNYHPRAFDPRCGYADISYDDYSVPLGESIHKRLIIRHRLEKKN